MRLFLLIFLAPLFSLLELKAQSSGTDAALTLPKPYTLAPASYKGIKQTSQYLTMRDGTRIAVDVYFPKNLQAQTPLPVLLRQTRYWRRPQLRFPLNMFSNGLLGRTGKMIKTFIEQGYIIVNVDVRGSGASFGERHYPWSQDEIQDGYEILDWISQQTWCSGKIGSLGVSYDGTAAEFLASTQHPNLKAVVLMFSLFDTYTDNAFPGGVHHSWFTESWAEANARMDANRLPANYRKLKPIVKGVAKVKGEKQAAKLLRQAVQEHQDNSSVHLGALSIDFRDDQPHRQHLPPVDSFSPHRVVQQIAQSQVIVYSYTGWHDGGYQHAALKRHINLPPNRGHKTIIGPWEHGGQFNISPLAYKKSEFDHAAEILKFFDFHLKGIDNGLDQEAPIHLYNIGSETWQAFNHWPPQDYENTTFYLHAQGNLNQDPPTLPFIASYYENNDFGTGNLTRWKALNGKVQQPQTYQDWTERSQALLRFTTQELDADYDMTGHPLVQVQVAFGHCEGAIFAYLEDISPDGKIYPVTEGRLKASHRKTNPEKAPYQMAVPVHSFSRTDENQTPENTFIELEFDLLPMSYTFKKGHRLALSFSGGDRDHFEVLNPQGYQIELRQGSKLILPLKKL